jgi:Transmembrane secretion effector
MFVASSQQENRSLWLTLKNRVFFRLWIAALLSVCCVFAHDTAATWLMSALGISAVPFVPDSHKRVSAVLSFRLACWNNL